MHARTGAVRIVKEVYLWPLLSLAVVANAGAVLENRPDSSLVLTPQVGWLSGLGIGMGQLSCCDALKGTPFKCLRG